MPQGSDDELLRRCWDFELALGEAVAERVEDVGGDVTAVLDTRIPQVWDSNYLVVESDHVTAQEVAAKADEVLGGLEMKHRAALTRDPTLGDRIGASPSDRGRRLAGRWSGRWRRSRPVAIWQVPGLPFVV